LLPPVPSDIIIKDRQEFRYYKLFKAGGIALLATLFIILLTSFLIYNHYYSLNRELLLSMPGSEQQQKQLRTIEQKIKQKEQFLSQSGWDINERTSYYADRIASLVPADVLLTSMNIYPTVLPGNETNTVRYKKDTIQITGSCPDPALLNRFTNGLKIIPDFREVSVKSYQYTKEKETGLFSVDIITK
jgi:hypothetical protein